MAAVRPRRIGRLQHGLEPVDPRLCSRKQGYPPLPIREAVEPVRPPPPVWRRPDGGKKIEPDARPELIVDGGIGRALRLDRPVGARPDFVEIRRRPIRPMPAVAVWRLRAVLGFTTVSRLAQLRVGLAAPEPVKVERRPYVVEPRAMPPPGVERA